jgi:uncharacterized protein with FMN-binding domain
MAHILRVQPRPFVSSKDRAANNLVVLGAAAILTVYAAGYARTQPAAKAFDDEVDERRLPPAPRIDVPLPTVASPAVAPVERPTPARQPKKKSTAMVDSAKAIESVVSAPAPPAQPVPQPAPQPSTPAGDIAKPVTAPAPDTSTKPAAIEPVVLKDGVYFAWGTSRHGDVQMGVEIKGARITSAFISECYTQYDCSWIAHLPKQVVQRQSADVDFVSGATHSANALYKAVVNALKQAK